MRQPRLVLFLTLCGLSFTVQQTVVIPALPVIQEEFDTTTAWATWLLTGPLLTASVAGPLLGRLGDQYGRGRMLAVSLGIFCAGSVGAACAWDIASLIVFRAVQGVGGAIFPLSFAILREALPRERLRSGIAFVSTAYGVGGVLGIVIAGPIVDHLGWRALFVLGAVGLGGSALLAGRTMPPPGERVAKPSLDLAGAVLLSAALVSFLLALTEGARWGWLSMPIVALFAAAAVLLLVWVRVELRVRDPMVDIRMLAGRQMLFANLTSLHLGYVMFVGQLLVPAFVMTSDASFGFASSPTGAGLYMLPTSAGMLVSVPVAGRLARRVRPSRLIAAGMALTGVGTAAFAVFHAHPWQVYAANSLRGLGLGLVVALMPLLVVAAADPKRTGVATGLNNVLRTVGGLAGAQISAALLAALTIAGSERPAEIGFVAAMWASTGVSLAGAWLALLVTGRAAAGAAPETAARPLTPPAGGLPLRRSG